MFEKEIKKIIIEASYEANACHIGSALSCVKILDRLFFGRMKENDVFIFSKASGAAAYYATLALKGYFSKEKVAEYLKNYPLPNIKVPGVLFSGGSLGHGLPFSAGLALADRARNVFVLLGEGEVQEGTMWETVLFAAQNKLENLKIIIDRNGLQACGATEDICAIEKALEKLNEIFPIEVVRTIKGEGVDFMENDYRWHYWNLNKENYEKAIFQVS